ncbi:hypothetical protein SNEBB_005743 [Seison nebaliae]|nr:hypothetical protein SNEBB_005743 [Seison nebaliae]
MNCEQPSSTLNLHSLLLSLFSRSTSDRCTIYTVSYFVKLLFAHVVLFATMIFIYKSYRSEESTYDETKDELESTPVEESGEDIRNQSERSRIEPPGRDVLLEDPYQMNHDTDPLTINMLSQSHRSMSMMLSGRNNCAEPMNMAQMMNETTNNSHYIDHVSYHQDDDILIDDSYEAPANETIFPNLQRYGSRHMSMNEIPHFDDNLTTFSENMTNTIHSAPGAQYHRRDNADTEADSFNGLSCSSNRNDIGIMPPYSEVRRNTLFKEISEEECDALLKRLQFPSASSSSHRIV